jgi:hypothetical protein
MVDWIVGVALERDQYLLALVKALSRNQMPQPAVKTL